MAASPKSSSYFLYKFNSDLEEVYKAQIPYKRSILNGLLEAAVYVSPNAEHAYVVWADKKNYMIHQVNPDGQTKKLLLTKAKFRDRPYTFFCTDTHLAALVYFTKTETHFMGLIDHERFRAKPAIPLDLPKVEKTEMTDEKETTWDFIQYTADHLIFSRRLKIRNEETQDADEREDRLISKIFVAEIDYKGKLKREFEIKSALENNYRPIISRTCEKGPNSSQFIGQYNSSIINSQYYSGSLVGLTVGEFDVHQSSELDQTGFRKSRTRLMPNLNSFGTLMYHQKTDHYFYYGIHNLGDLDNGSTRSEFLGFFISEYDANGTLLKHVQYSAPSEEEMEDSDLSSRMKGGFGRQMKLEIKEDGNLRFKLWTFQDFYIAELNSDLEIREYNLYIELEKITDIRKPQSGDRVIYPANHPVSKYLASLGDLHLDLINDMYLRAMEGAAGQEILIHMSDMKKRDNAVVLLFSEN
ncbi:hypothetical protein [Croceimicrobium hydrocarbonivorans]|uniref:Uncharacterized protein n=1 Tax=Croceimicrobium hydrocarbonivorans TaxID=2761580 RepID=A0A7H0VED7_9FLAO|nr:hypothetical protein [Croceimicrobium hydrocarbonivorans]QNR24085.1 hypothetical protein H4K34_17205 [Croceimicrobium hydrocarbonivorans]